MSGFDVVVMGEVLVELSSREPCAAGADVTLGFSGDALNAAASAVAAGAHTALLARVADDELGQAILARVRGLGIDDSLVQLVAGQQGAYFVHSDPAGAREFTYLRRGSAGSGLCPQDVVAAELGLAAVVVTSGITAAISPSAAQAVDEAARTARSFVYDPNFRPRLTGAAEAAEVLRSVARFATLVTPAAPTETEALLGCDDPREAARRCRAWGAAAVAVTRGASGVLVDDGSQVHDVPAVPPGSLVDQTGAGDALVGAVAGRLALGDSLLEAVRLGTSAASLCLQHQGGTGPTVTLDQLRSHLGRAARP